MSPNTPKYVPLASQGEYNTLHANPAPLHKHASPGRSSPSYIVLTDIATAVPRATAQYGCRYGGWQRSVCATEYQQRNQMVCVYVVNGTPKGLEAERPLAIFLWTLRGAKGSLPSLHLILCCRPGSCPYIVFLYWLCVSNAVRRSPRACVLLQQC